MSRTNDQAVDVSMATALDALLCEASVTRAAKKLGVTQSAASHRLKQLREALGDALLVPGKGGLVPTARGQVIAGPLRKALADLAAALETGRLFEPRTSARTFALAFRDYGEFVILRHLLALVAAGAPSASLVVQAPNPGFQAALTVGALDMYVGVPGPTAAGLRQKVVMREPFVVVARQGHPYFARKPTLERYLSGSHIVVAPEGMRGTRIDSLLASRGLSRRIALRVPSFVSSPFLAAHTDLLLTVPLGLAASAAQHVPLQWAPLPSELTLEPSNVVMVWHERVQQDAGHRWLRGRVVEAVAQAKREMKARQPGSAAHRLSP